MQQTVFALICFLAFAQAGYVILRAYEREFRHCAKPAGLGIFFENDKCHQVGPNQYTIAKCNSTYTQLRQNCNKECQQCRNNETFPNNQCIHNTMKFSCEDKLPLLEQDGAIMRAFPNEKCDRDASNTGVFYLKSHCAEIRGGSHKVGLTDPRTFKQVTYDQVECKGNVIKEIAHKLDVCVRNPNSFQKIMTMKQPAQYIMITRK